jgi:hypothetical protein
MSLRGNSQPQARFCPRCTLLLKIEHYKDPLEDIKKNWKRSERKEEKLKPN